MAARKKGQPGTRAARAQGASTTASEKPSDDPEALRKVHAENLRKAGEALRALKLPNDVEPAVVFRA